MLKIWLLLVGIVVLRWMSGRHHAAQRLDAERERRHVEEQDVVDLALEHAGLDGGADGDHLVRVDALVRLLAEELAHRLLDQRHARLPADEHDLVDLRGGDAGVGEGLLAGPQRALDEVADQLLQLGAGEGDVHVLGAGGVGGDEGQVDLRLHDGGELALGLLRRLLEALQGHAVLLEVDALVALELVARASR